MEGSEEDQPVKKPRLMPKKGEFRMRAHCNPFNSTKFPLYVTSSPLTPAHVDWSLHYEQNEVIYCNSGG